MGPSGSVLNSLACGALAMVDPGVDHRLLGVLPGR